MHFKNELMVLAFWNLNEAGLNTFDTHAFLLSAEISIYLKACRLMHYMAAYILEKLSCYFCVIASNENLGFSFIKKNVKI